MLQFVSSTPCFKTRHIREEYCSLCHLSLHLCLGGLQLVIDLLDLGEHGCLRLPQDRKLLFGLLSLFFHTFKFFTCSLILLRPQWKELRMCACILSSSSCAQHLRLATHHPRFLLLQQLDDVQMPLLFIVPIHIVLVPLIPLLGLFQEARLFLQIILQRNTQSKTQGFPLHSSQHQNLVNIIIQ